MPKQVRLLQTWNPVVGGGSGSGPEALPPCGRSRVGEFVSEAATSTRLSREGLPQCKRSLFKTVRFQRFR